MASEGRAICLLTGRDALPPWFERALVAATERADARVALVVRTGGRDGPPLDHPFDAPTRHVDPVEVDGGPRVRLPDATVDRVAAETDVVVHSGVGILTGRILTAPEHGVLSYHHGDLRRYRGVLVHLWNYLNRDDEGGVTIQQLTEDLDAGRVVAERTVDLSDAVTWGEVEHRKHEAGVPLVAEAVTRLDSGFEPSRVPDDELGPVYRSSDVTLGVVARYLALETAKTSLDRLRRLRYLLGVSRD
jgi:folate-dependent phosphoribosylglycinamide formyltransferase PurN